MDLARYRSLFVSEAREHLQSMSQEIMKLTGRPSPEACDVLFRASHSIKGMAASMGYLDLKGISHQLEDVFTEMKKSELPVDDEILAVLLEGIDTLSCMVDEIEQTGVSHTSTASFQEALEKIQGKFSSSKKIRKTPVAEAVPEAKYFYKIEIRISEDAALPAARAMVALKRLEDLGRISRLLPDLEEIKKGNFKRELSCFLLSMNTASEVQEMMSTLTELSDFSVFPVDPQTKHTPSQLPVSQVPKIRNVRLQTSLIDRVVEGLGEMMIYNNLLQDHFPDNPEISRLRALTHRVYEDATDLRMMPFEMVSASFPRIIYELARKFQKKIRLYLEGAEIRLDRSILDGLADPLVHLLRNAVDHGIEMPAVRVQKGKSEAGNIRVSVVRKGDRILIRVEDDGKGLDPEAIRETAVQLGIVDERAAAFLTPQELFLLVTRPGFSTVAEVSDVSGRGVGLDVVRSNLEALGGELRISSLSGEYTRFEITVPFTVAVISALLIRAGQLLYAIPLSRIERLVEVKKKDLHYTQGRAVFYYNDNTMYIENLEQILTGATEIKFPNEFPAVITEHQSRRIAWSVQELVTETQILMKPLEEPLSLIGCYSGAAILSKGEVVPVLDLEQLYRERW